MIRIGIDFGGTKIEVAALDPAGAWLARRREANPGEYRAAIETVRRLVLWAEANVGVARAPVGVGMPGSISPVTGLARNANSVWLNNMPFHKDLAAALDRPIRTANDANCLVLSEATDGAAVGAGVVFGAILGTGCGGGVVVDGKLIEGRNGVGGEWGHAPLPWASALERDPAPCWCGRRGCLETWISGSAFGRLYFEATGERASGDAIIDLVRAGHPQASLCFDLYVDRLGRALAAMCDVIDPDIIVFGGGMSNVAELYERVGPVIAKHIFSDSFSTPVVPARHGDSSGVRGAARLWPLP